MQKEKMYTFVVGNHTNSYNDVYVKARTVEEAVEKAIYEMEMPAEILMCSELDIDTYLPEEQNERMKKIQELDTKRKIVESLMDSPTVVTHYGDDLDNKSSIEAIKRFAIKIKALKNSEELKIERVPAGKVKEGFLNVDTGGHKGNRSDNETKTIVIDGDTRNGIKSACQSLSNLGIYVPEQICELADARPIHISALDSRSGLALVRYLSGEQTFNLAENHLLDKSLTDKQLQEYGLTEAHTKQQKIIDSAVEKINKYTETLPTGEKMVFAPEQIIAGSSIAYEMGIPYYASAQQHFDAENNPDGVTFAITCKSGMELPKEILEYGKQLVEKYRRDERSSEVFIHPNNQLIVAGGSKNPNFKIEGYTPESIIEELKTVIGNTYINKIVNAAEQRASLKEKTNQAAKLAQDYENQLPKTFENE